MFSSHITRFIVAWLLFGGIGAFGAKCLAAGGKVERPLADTSVLSRAVRILWCGNGAAPADAERLAHDRNHDAELTTDHASTAASGAQHAAQGVLQRLLPAHVDRFVFESLPPEDGHDVFELESRADRIVLRGSSGVAMCSALNWYLEQYCRCHVSWLGRHLELPEPLPRVSQKVRQVSPHRYRYWLNYCAFSYSLAFWHWPEWEEFIDWMALHGINMPLAITGQEAAWQATGRRLGLSDEQIAQFLPGPAYLPFGWMGCLDGWGGPLPRSWIDGHRELQQRILARQRALGMTPVLQGFTGHVPGALKDKFPASKFHQVRWAGFAPTHFIDPSDPLFLEVGRVFHEEQTRLFGTDHFYASDTFVEMMPPSNDPAFLAGMGKAVYQAMSAADPQAHWLMQGWIFTNNPKFWQAPQASALFNAVPDGRLILIEMGGDKFLETQAYYGKPWIWTTIRNFGNVTELGGNLGNIISRSRLANSSTQRGRLQGSGATMEGLGYDPAVFELVADFNWRDDITHAQDWVTEFIHHRYGHRSARMDRTWQGLLATVYHKPGGDGIICMRPWLKPRRRGRNQAAYDNRVLAAAARDMLACADEFGDRDTYRYDLVNVTRQALVNTARPVYAELVQAFADGDRRRVEAAGHRLHQLIVDIDRLLATRREFLLGRWIADAKAWATCAEEACLYEWNARNQITVWGSPSSRLDGYARKHWAGLLADFYAARWALFVTRLLESLEADRPFDADAFEQECQAWDGRWTHADNAFAAEPAGDAIEIAGELLQRYADALDSAVMPETGSQPQPSEP